MIRVCNLTKNYGDLQILRNITIEIQAGEVVAIIGPSGGGKSTFLRCLNLLEIPTSGTIFIDGVDITESKININTIRQKVSMVFQHFNLFANKNVLENLTLAPIKTGMMSKEEAIQKATLLLDRIGLKDKANIKPSKLSGGQSNA